MKMSDSTPVPHLSLNVSEKTSVARSFSMNVIEFKLVVSSFNEGELVYTSLLKLLFAGLRLEVPEIKKIGLVNV